MIQPTEPPLVRTIEGSTTALQCSTKHINQLIATGTIREVLIPSPTGHGRPLRRIREDDLQNLLERWTTPRPGPLA